MLDALGVLPKESRQDRILPPAQVGSEKVSDMEAEILFARSPKRKVSRMDGSRDKHSGKGLAKSKEETDVEMSATTKGGVAHEEEWEVVDGEMSDA